MLVQRDEAELASTVARLNGVSGEGKSGTWIGVVTHDGRAVEVKLDWFNDEEVTLKVCRVFGGRPGEELK
jgi:hypothetical protein